MKCLTMQSTKLLQRWSHENALAKAPPDKTHMRTAHKLLKLRVWKQEEKMSSQRNGFPVTEKAEDMEHGRNRGGMQ